jgi:hypothetical protein
MNPRMSLDAWMRFNSYRYLDGKRERTRPPLPDMLNTTEFLTGDFNGLTENERYWDKWNKENRATIPKEEVQIVEKTDGRSVREKGYACICLECGKYFKSTTYRAKYCSNRCRSEEEKRRAVATYNPFRPSKVDERCFIKSPPVQPILKSRWGTAVCPECGHHFGKKRENAKYCSEKCRIHAQNGRYKAKQVGQHTTDMFEEKALVEKALVALPMFAPGEEKFLGLNRKDGSWIEEYIKRRNLREL